MKRFLVVALSFVFALSLLVACGGGSKTTKVGGSTLETIEDPFQDLTDMANAIIEAGGVASVGQGTSKRMDLAKKKAVTAAQGGLSEIFNAKVNKLKKSFQEEIGSADDSEINEAFTDVVKVLSSTVLRGAVVKKVKYMRDKDTGQITAAAVVAIEPNKINMSILDELKTKKPKLYERFRASQAYDELKKEMDAYENQQNAGY